MVDPMMRWGVEDCLDPARQLIDGLGVQHELVTGIEHAAEGHHDWVKADQNQGHFEQHRARKMLGPTLPQRYRQIIFLTGMVDNMHRPNPAAAMGDPVMAIKAQVIKDETNQKSPRVYRQGEKLERLNQGQNAKCNKGRHGIHWVTQHPHQDAQGSIFGRHFSVCPKQLDGNQFDGKEREKEDRRIKADITVNELGGRHALPPWCRFGPLYRVCTGG